MGLIFVSICSLVNIFKVNWELLLDKLHACKKEGSSSLHRFLIVSNESCTIFQTNLSESNNTSLPNGSLNGQTQ